MMMKKTTLMYYNGGLQFCAVSGSNGMRQLDKCTEHRNLIILCI